MRKAYTVNFDGFWSEGSLKKVPTESGVYVVFAGVYDDDSDTVSLEKTLYIGAGSNVQEVIKASPLWDEWKEASCLPLDADNPEDGLGDPNELYFAFAPVEGEENSDRVASAMVFEQKPPVNDESGYSQFSYADTKIELTGKTGILNTAYEIVFE